MTEAISFLNTYLNLNIPEDAQLKFHELKPDSVDVLVRHRGQYKVINIDTVGMCNLQIGSKFNILLTNYEDVETEVGANFLYELNDINIATLPRKEVVSRICETIFNKLRIRIHKGYILDTLKDTMRDKITLRLDDEFWNDPETVEAIYAYISQQSSFNHGVRAVSIDVAQLYLQTVLNLPKPNWHRFTHALTRKEDYDSGTGTYILIYSTVGDGGVKTLSIDLSVDVDRESFDLNIFTDQLPEEDIIITSDLGYDFTLKATKK